MIEPMRAEINSSGLTGKPKRAATLPPMGVLWRQGSRNGLLYSIDADTEQVRHTERYEVTGWPVTSLLLRPILADLMLAGTPYWKGHLQCGTRRL
jgi:hypothetical protein